MQGTNPGTNRRTTASLRTYAPTITTPVQLQERLGALIAFLKKEKSKAPAVITI
jgi:hypothetical protein